MTAPSPVRASAPPYFETVRAEAARRWDQLEADPDLAAPWHQLFRQVQSPRHVISELLQNADDAEATWARVKLTADAFLFEHNGRDFDETAFRSLCRFGFSNKRHLHTIGFRGIGFKSTFSVGPRVELTTPTLRVAFDKRRFTEPTWLPEASNGVDGVTRVRIPLGNAEVRAWLSEELQRWAADPVPILFFRHLQSLDLQGALVSRTEEGPGPVPNTTWLRLQGLREHALLRVASDEEPFPDDALAEVRAERGDPAFELPPCRVELVVGVPDPRLYVVLPTEVRLGLPFAINAPFLQDPARTGIKDPIGSPTNRWLLRRAGQLAAESLRGWVSAGDLPIGERAKAYAALLPKQPDVEVRSLAYDVEATVREGVRERLEYRPILLTSEGAVVKARGALDLPADLLNVWPTPTWLALLGRGEVAVLAAEVGRDGRRRLEEWGLLRRFETQAFLDRLQSEPHPLRPEDDAALVRLWAYVQGLLSQERHRRAPAGALALLPVSDDDGLYPADEVVIAGGSEDRLRPDEWAFISRFVPVADPKWIGLLLAASKATDNHPKLDDAVRLFRALDLAQRTGLQEAVFGAARRIFAQDDPGDDGLRIARIAARADLQAPDDFQFLCDDGAWRPVSEGLLVDVENALTYFPLEWVSSRLISARYTAEGTPQEQETWRLWATGPRSGLRQFVLPEPFQRGLYGRKAGEAFAIDRGGRKPSTYHLTTYDFRVEDHDFDAALWDGWESQAATDPSVWPTVVRGIRADWDAEWKARSVARLRQLGNKYAYAVNHGSLVAAWVHRLRGFRCLPDASGRLRLPAELYRANAHTAHLAGVEPFLAPELDTEYAADLLALLGVRDRPDSLDTLLGRVRALAGTDAPVEAVHDLYRALDRSVSHVPEEVLDGARRIFAAEPLVRDADGGWHTAPSVFQRNTEGVPGLPVLAAEVAGLRLWDRLGVPAQPTADTVLDWLRSLPVGEALDDATRARVRAVLPRLPQRVWDDVGAWLDGAGRWAATEALQYSSADARGVDGLFPRIVWKAADLSMLPAPLRVQPPFNVLRPLDQALSFQLHDARRVGEAREAAWLAALGRGLLAARPTPGASSEAVERRREAGQRLLRTRWQDVATLDAVPTLDGTPAGPQRAFDVLWVDDDLLATDEGPRIYQDLVAALAAPVEEPRLRQAVEDCAGRAPGWIVAYFEAHFALDDVAPAEDERDEGDGTPDEPPAPVSEGEEGTEEDEEEVVTKKRKRKGVTAAERGYWEAKEYVYDEVQQRFVDSDGATVQRQSGPFHWVAYDAEGALTGRYWVTGQRLDEGVEVPAEVWEVVRHDARAALLIPAATGGLRRYDGARLDQLVRSGAATLHPAAYRLLTPKD